MNNRPNILVITTHDSGCHFGCYGVPTVRTPNIDALAADGVRFTRMYATAPICSPSRASLMTGQYPATHGLLGLTGRASDGARNWGGRMTHPRHHLAVVAGDSGYQTALFGAQHEIGEPDRVGHDLIDPVGNTSSPLPSHAAALVADRFATWITQRTSDRPFFAQIGFHETHTPYDHHGTQPDESLGVHVPAYCTDPAVRQAFKGLSSKLPNPEDDAALRGHLAMFQGSLRSADEAVGRILQSLHRAGLDENTIVLFNTDHGPELPHAKWTVHDAGCRIAFILRWPAGNVTGGRICDRLSSNADFVPTLAQWAGLEPPHRPDGVGFADDLGPRPASTTRDHVLSYMHYGNVFSLRTRRFNLLRCLKGGVRKTAQGYITRYPFELFDTQSDPLELRDVSNAPAYAEDFHQLSTRFWSLLESLRDPILSTPLEM